jgi:diacylglycerol kinase (ATP)
VEFIDEELLMAAVATRPTAAASRSARMPTSDGLLDLTFAPRARLLRRCRGAGGTRLPEVRTARARRVRLQAGGTTAYADGDPTGTLPGDRGRSERAAGIPTRGVTGDVARRNPPLDRRG